MEFQVNLRWLFLNSLFSVAVHIFFVDLLWFKFISHRYFKKFLWISDMFMDLHWFSADFQSVLGLGILGPRSGGGKSMFFEPHQSTFQIARPQDPSLQIPGLAGPQECRTDKEPWTMQYASQHGGGLTSVNPCESMHRAKNNTERTTGSTVQIWSSLTLGFASVG